MRESALFLTRNHTCHQDVARNGAVTIRAAPQRTPPSARRPTASLRPSASVRPSGTALDAAKNAVVALLEKERKLEIEIERRCIARSGLGGTTPTATKQAKNVAGALAAFAKVSSHLHRQCAHAHYSPAMDARSVPHPLHRVSVHRRTNRRPSYRARRSRSSRRRTTRRWPRRARSRSPRTRRPTTSRPWPRGRGRPSS